MSKFVLHPPARPHTRPRLIALTAVGASRQSGSGTGPSAHHQQVGGLFPPLASCRPHDNRRPEPLSPLWRCQRGFHGFRRLCGRRAETGGGALFWGFPPVTSLGAHTPKSHGNPLQTTMTSTSDSGWTARTPTPPRCGTGYARGGAVESVPPEPSSSTNPGCGLGQASRAPQPRCTPPAVLLLPPARRPATRSLFPFLGLPTGIHGFGRLRGRRAGTGGGLSRILPTVVPTDQKAAATFPQTPSKPASDSGQAAQIPVPRRRPAPATRAATHTTIKKGEKS